ncbi:MAG TPA: hypothetical protein VK826_01395 [Bacteroidia bacterium]|nr:hypothetical protein [Bacteroidia bacterium]
MKAVHPASYSTPEIVAKAKFTIPNAYIIKPFKNEDLLVAIELALFNSPQKKVTNPARMSCSFKKEKYWCGLTATTSLILKPTATTR